MQGETEAWSNQEIDKKNKEYFNKIPEAIEEQEVEWKIKDRRSRKNNIIIRRVNGQTSEK